MSDATSHYMPTFRINQDGSFETDDLDSAVAFYERLAERRAVPAARPFFTNTTTGLVAHGPVAKTPKGSLPDGVTEKVAELINHAHGNADTFGILATLQAARGREVLSEDIAKSIGLTDTVRLSGKLAGIIKTANRLQLDPVLVMVRHASGYNKNRRISYHAGKGLLAAPALRPDGSISGGAPV